MHMKFKALIATVNQHVLELHLILINCQTTNVVAVEIIINVIMEFAYLKIDAQ